MLLLVETRRKQSSPSVYAPGNNNRFVPTGSAAKRPLEAADSPEQFLDVTRAAVAVTIAVTVAALALDVAGDATLRGFFSFLGFEFGTVFLFLSLDVLEIQPLGLDGVGLLPGVQATI